MTGITQNIIKLSLVAVSSDKKVIQKTQVNQLIEKSGIILKEIPGSGKLSVSFDFQDVAAGFKLIGSILANKRVYKTTLEIIDAFESILIDVGDADAHGRLLWSAQNNPEIPAFYISFAEVDYISTTQLLIYFTGSSETGSGKITIYYS